VRKVHLAATDDVDEAVLLGDRVVVMAPRPGRIADVFDVAVARPRDGKDPALLTLRNKVLDALDATQHGALSESAPRPGPQRPRALASAVPLAARPAV
jgi:sulfonate transport system ATP-binding protein